MGDPLQPLLHDLAVAVRAPSVCLSAPALQVRPGGVQGLISGDVRVLDRAVLTVDGTEPEPVAHATRSAGVVESIGLLRRLGDPGADPTVWVRRRRTVRADGLDESVVVVNRSSRALDVTLALEVGADLAPIETIKRGLAGEPVAPVVGDGVLTWAADGVDVRLAAPGARTGPDGPTWTVRVPARDETGVDWSVRVVDGGAVVAPAGGTLHRPAVRADDPRLARLLARALDDLDALLVTDPGSDDVYAAAGAPWFLTLFGRDSLWTATLLLPLDVRVAAGTLRTLARAQGTRTDPATGEQPGKIPHERRRGAGDHGGGMVLPPLYYGTVDATPLWVCLLRDAWRRGMPDAEVRALLDPLRAALGWIAEHADRDGDGFAEYLDESGHGLANQGWKDSGDAIRFADGRIADGPVALVEVQGYVHEAALAGAELLEALDDDAGAAARWRAFAAALADRFRACFWTDGGYPALALDGDKKPVDALTSNIGHLLGTGIVDDAEAAAITGHLVGAGMLAAHGLRTMSDRAGGYSPLSYHCGSVWPHDTAIVLRGLTRTGLAAAAAALAGRLLDAAEAFDGRLPELLGGQGTEDVAAPVPYPAACRPQAWAAAALPAVLHALLGLEVDVPAGEIRIRPLHPSPVGALSVRGLRVAGGTLDLDVDADGMVRVHSSPLHVVVP